MTGMVSYIVECDYFTATKKKHVGYWLSFEGVETTNVSHTLPSKNKKTPKNPDTIFITVFTSFVLLQLFFL